MGTPRRLRFCLVTSAHVSNNPRLVKEADALAAAGHEVRVVAVNARPDLAERDETVMRGREWRLARIAVRRGGEGRRRWLLAALRARLARWLYDRGVRTPAVRDFAVSRYVDHLARAAASEPADVIVGHNLAALPAAARAARKLGARLGFDLEDLHLGELADTPANAAERRLVIDVESAYLPQCDLLTASADGIADEVARRYGVSRPVVVYNVFPLAERPTGPTRPRDRVADRPSLYWYSQVLGPDRGLEDAVAALAQLGFPADLHLRGAVDDGYREALSSLADRLGVGRALHFHPPEPPGELVALASEHDVGLALEQPVSLNRALCVTNKLFTYLVSGIAVAATDTPGQRTVLEQCEGAGFLYRAGDVDALAQGLRQLLSSPERLALARARALEAARTRFCWEREQETLVQYLAGDERAPLGANVAMSGAA